MFSEMFVLCCLLLQFHFVYGCTTCKVRIDQTLKDTIQCKSGKIVDMSVSVVTSKEVLFVGGYSNSNRSVTGDTVFQVASLTKAFASTLLVKLLEQNKRYSLDTTLKDILNNNNIFHDSLRSNHVTIRDLLSHRTGLPDHNMIRLDNNLTRVTVVERLKYIEAEKEFRGSYLYSSVLYGVITYLAEIIGGNTWENLVKEHIFDPLGMTSSTFVTTANHRKIHLTTGYDEYFGELRSVSFEFASRYGELCGSGGILTTARDMTKWMTFLLRGGQLDNGTRLLSKNAFDSLITPNNMIPDSSTSKYFSKPNVPATNDRYAYGLGWMIGSYRGYRSISHTGATYGYRAMISWYPDVDLGIFTVLTGVDLNSYYRQTLHNYIFDVYTNHSLYLNTSIICTYPSPWFDQSPILTKQPERKDKQISRHRREYCGTYYNPAYGYIVLSEHNDTNKLTLTYGYVTYVLYPSTNTDEFYGDSTGTSIHVFNLHIFRFLFKANDVSLEVPSFKSKSPPLFHRANIGYSINDTFSVMGIVFYLLLINFVN